MNGVGMDLAIDNQRPRPASSGRAQLQQKLSAVFLDVAFGVLFCEAQVQGSAAIACGGTARPRAEPMDQPGNLLEPRGMDYL
jgi:hypothetical protein